MFQAGFIIPEKVLSALLLCSFEITTLEPSYVRLNNISLAFLLACFLLLIGIPYHL